MAACRPLSDAREAFGETLLFTLYAVRKAKTTARLPPATGKKCAKSALV
jgi:hypothetical protein